MKKVVILRGVPGSGKSTYALDYLANNYHYWNRIFSADHYFIRPDDVYDWNPKLLSNAHNWCFDSFLYYIEGMPKNVVFIDNTNIKPANFKKYIDAAQERGYVVEYKIFQHDPQEETKEEYVEKCFKRCTHGVPKETIERMYNQLLNSLGEQK